jgi:hypothetical protein
VVGFFDRVGARSVVFALGHGTLGAGPMSADGVFVRGAPVSAFGSVDRVDGGRVASNGGLNGSRGRATLLCVPGTGFSVVVGGFREGIGGEACREVAWACSRRGGYVGPGLELEVGGSVRFGIGLRLRLRLGLMVNGGWSDWGVR